jgi:PAS domain S-box-containing protein
VKANTRQRSGARVYSIYFVLALVNLATVAVLLGWSYRTSRDYRAALQENRRSSERLARLITLRAAAAGVNAAAADVFVTGDSELQLRRLHEAVARFDAAMDRCRAADASEGGTFDGDYLYMRSAMGEMSEVAETIVRIAEDDPVAAATRLPRLHAALRNLMSRGGKIAERVHSDQLADFARQTTTYDTMVQRGEILSLLVVLFVIAVTVHGVRVARELGSARERERYIDALQQREAQLRAAIAERDEQQKLLRQREELLIETEQLGTIGNFCWDIVHDTVYWSDELCRILGVRPGFSDANYETYLSRVHRDDRDRIFATINQTVSACGQATYEHRWVQPKGDTCLIRVKAKVETDSDGRPARMVGVVQDITEQRATMEILRRREFQLQEAQRLANVGSWDWTAETDEGTWSDELYRIVGADPATTPPTFTSYLSLIHPDDRQFILDDQQAGLAQHRERVSNEHRILRPDGEVRHVILQATVRYEPSGTFAVGTVQDITERKRIDETLRISEERFALAALATNEVIWDWNPATNKIWANEAFAARYGFSESASGQWDTETWLENLHPDDRESVEQSFYNAIASGEQHWSSEYRARFQDGDWHHVLDRGYLIRDDGGNVVRVIGASQDIDERARAAEELARLHRQNELVLNSTVDGIFGADHEGRFNLVNVAGARMFGWSVEEMIGQPSHTLLHHSHADGSPYPVEECPIAETLKEGKRQRAADVFWRKDGTTVPVEWSSNPMIGANGDIVGVVVTCTDITERLKIDRMKDEFVSTVSHELRTPLTAIRGALGLLATGRMGVFPEKAQRLLEIAATNTDRLVRLINDILDIEKLESGKLTLSQRPVAVDDVIEQAVEGVRPLLERAQIAVSVESSTEVISMDPDRILQTLTNLLSNAIKFSPSGSMIRVKAHRKGAEIQYSVADEGRGIPSDKLEAIFERFEQVDASDSRNKGGSGLGLAICRSIVRQHGGTIRAESEPGRGSTFLFTIPAPLPEASIPVEPRRKVLLCDDDDLAREAMRCFLEQGGFEVQEVASGESLLIALRKGIPDVILLDVLMPDMNGFEVLARIKSEPATAALPVVIVSIVRPDEVRSVEGFCTWVPKPLSQNSLLTAVNQALDSSVKPRVLIVEDDLDLARVIAASFDQQGIESTHAATGREAIEIARRMGPDLLVLDLMLPDIDGYSIVQSLRTDDRCRNLPLLVYSALEPSAEQREHLRLGPTEFLLKSRVAPEEFDRRIRALLDSITRPESGGLSDAA